MRNLTTAQIMEQFSLHALAVHAWHADHGRTIAALSLKLMRSEQMGATPVEARRYTEQRMGALPSLEALKARALSFGPVEIAEAELTIARGAFVDADDAALQAILSYKAERDYEKTRRPWPSWEPRVADRRRRAALYVKLRREARAKVHAARDRLEAARVEAALDRIEQHWPTRANDPAHPYVNIAAE
jgi:hypothetical protein